MAIARVANNTWVSASSLSGSTVDGDGLGQRVAVTLPDSVQAGSLLVAVVEIWANETLTFGDNSGVNTWQSLVTRYYGAGGAAIAIGYAMNCAAGSTRVYCRSASNVNRAIAVSEYTGAATASAADGNSSATSGGSSSTINPGAITTTTDGLIVSGCWYTDGGADVTALDGNYTLTQRAVSGGFPLFIQDRITTGAVSSHAASFTGNKSFWVSAVGAFKGAGGGASAVINTVSDETPNNGQTGITIGGTGFGASQGTGNVYISPTDNVEDSSAVIQTVTSWGDTSITITAVQKHLGVNAPLYLFVKTDGGLSNASGHSVMFKQLGPITPRTYARAQAATLSGTGDVTP